MPSVFDVRVDLENSAMTWWEAARAAVAADKAAEKAARARGEFHDRPIAIACCVALDDHEEFYGDAETVNVFVAWASQLPGWLDGPVYAPCPVLVREHSPSSPQIPLCVGSDADTVLIDNAGVGWLVFSVDAPAKNVAERLPALGGPWAAGHYTHEELDVAECLAYESGADIPYPAVAV